MTNESKAKEMIDLDQYLEDKINIWFTDHPEERLFLDDFVKKNNLQHQSLGLIIFSMSDKDRKQFTDLLKMIMSISEELLKTIGVI